MLDYAVLSKVGSREVNEDSVAAGEKKGSCCFVVCDGLGGHGMGDTASSLVANVFLEEFHSRDCYDGFLSSAFSLAQERLTARQSESRVTNKMRTTAAALFTDGQNAFIGHVGDSRVYVFRRQGEAIRTLDHSVPQILALSGEITEAQISQHPDRNMLLRAMGTAWDQPMYQLMPPVALSECRAFLLCSDGFWEYISADQMQSLLRQSRTAEEWLRAMQRLVEQAGAGEKMDNYSAIAIVNPSCR